MFNEKKGELIILDSKQDFTQNIIEILKTNKISIKPYNNNSVDRLYHSYVKTLKWVFEQSNDNNNNLDKLKRIIISKIQQLKKEKKKSDLSHRNDQNHRGN